jgi:hypothetical protein
MIQLAGLQYSRAVHELRWNVNGCVRLGYPKGLEHGLNIQNDNPDPKRPDHTVFWLAPGHWTKPVRVGSKATRKITGAVRATIERDDALEDRRRKNQPAEIAPITPGLFPSDELERCTQWEDLG